MQGTRYGLHAQGPVSGVRGCGLEAPPLLRAELESQPSPDTWYSWQLEQFKAENLETGFGSATRALEQALEKTKANIKWVKENKEAVLEWFTQNSQ